MIKYLILISFLFGCATKPTKYQSMKKSEGFKDRVVENDLLAVTFKANSATKKDKAELYAKFRAIESCYEKGKNLTHVLDVMDKSQTKKVTKTDSTGPSYYYGMSPYYGRYYGGWGMGMGVGINTVSSRSWNETYVYPEFEVFYQCRDKVEDSRIFFKQISAENMKLLVKDLKGALQVEKILEDSPNKESLEVGDIILKVNNQRIESVLELYWESKGKNANLDIFREGVRKKVVLKNKDVSEAVEKTQLEIIRTACQKEEIKKRGICSSKEK